MLCTSTVFTVWLGLGAKKHLVGVRKRLYFGLLGFVATNTCENDPIYQLPTVHPSTVAAVNWLTHLATQLAVQTGSYGTGAIANSS